MRKKRSALCSERQVTDGSQYTHADPESTALPGRLLGRARHKNYEY